MSGLLWFIVAPEGSTSEQQLFWLFGLRPEGKSFISREFSDDEPELDFAARFILDEIGIEFEEPEADKLDSIIDKFGTTFPKTAEFSDLARLSLPEVHAEDDPDAALIGAWLDHEEALFRRLERRVVSSRIEACAFRSIRPPVPATSGHPYRGIRPPLTRCFEAHVFSVSWRAFRQRCWFWSFAWSGRRD